MTQQLRQLCRSGNVAAVFEALNLKCARGLGPAGCRHCALTAVIGFTLENDKSAVHSILKGHVGHMCEDIGEATSALSCQTACASTEKFPKQVAAVVPTLDFSVTTDAYWKYDCGRIPLPNTGSSGELNLPVVLRAAAVAGTVELLQTFVEEEPSLQSIANTAALLEIAAASGHNHMLDWLFHTNPALCGTVDTLRLAVRNGNWDTVHTLLQPHGAQTRRVTVPQTYGALYSVVSGGVQYGQAAILLRLCELTHEEDGFDGQWLKRTLFSTGEPSSGDDVWNVLTCTCEYGSADDLRVLLQQPAVLHFIAVAVAEAAEDEDADPLDGVPECSNCIVKMINRMHPSEAECAAKLRLLLALPPPYTWGAGWQRATEHSIGRDWDDGLRVLLHEMPPHHEQLRANFEHSAFFRFACSQNSVKTAEVLLQVTGPHAVDPRARHQAAMRTACWRNMPCIVELLLRQTGERAVRMQPGKRSFFWGALRPKRLAIRDFDGVVDGKRVVIRADDPRRDDKWGGYGALKLLLGATGVSAVPPAMWAHGGDGKCKRADLWGTAERGPVERQYRDVGWGGGIQRMARRDMVLLRSQVRRGSRAA